MVIANIGLDAFASFRDLAGAVPLAEPIRITAWRIPFSDIPTGPEHRIQWLDEQWLAIDRHVPLRGDASLAPRR